MGQAAQKVLDLLKWYVEQKNGTGRLSHTGHELYENMHSVQIRDLSDDRNQLLYLVLNLLS